MTLLRFPQRAADGSRAPRSEGRTDVPLDGPSASARDAELAPANLRFLLTPDHDHTLDYLDQLSGLDLLDDGEREARVALARRTGS